MSPTGSRTYRGIDYAQRGVALGKGSVARRRSKIETVEVAIVDMSLLVVGALGLVAIGSSLSVLILQGRFRRKVLAPQEEKMGAARREAQRILNRAEREGRARAEAYREREEAQLDHRRVELGASEERLIQREKTLEQRASNLAQREQMLLHREAAVSELRTEVELLAEDARTNLERISSLDANAAKKELVNRVRDEARREAMLLVRGQRDAGPGGGRPPSPTHPRHRNRATVHTGCDGDDGISGAATS